MIQINFTNPQKCQNDYCRDFYFVKFLVMRLLTYFVRRVDTLIGRTCVEGCRRVVVYIYLFIRLVLRVAARLCLKSVSRHAIFMFSSKRNGAV